MIVLLQGVRRTNVISRSTGSGWQCKWPTKQPRTQKCSIRALLANDSRLMCFSHLFWVGTSHGMECTDLTCFIELVDRNESDAVWKSKLGASEWSQIIIADPKSMKSMSRLRNNQFHVPWRQKCHSLWTMSEHSPPKYIFSCLQCILSPKKYKKKKYKLLLYQ